LNIEIRSESLEQLPCSALVVFGFEPSPASAGTVEQLPVETRAALEELQAGGELKGKLYECTLVHKPGGVRAAKLLVVGAGKKEKFNARQLRRRRVQDVLVQEQQRGQRLVLGRRADAAGSGEVR